MIIITYYVLMTKIVALILLHSSLGIEPHSKGWPNPSLPSESFKEGRKY